MSKPIKYEDAKYYSVSDYKPIITYAGDRELFIGLESIIAQGLPQEATEWRRSFGRVCRSVTLSAIFVPFSEQILEAVDNYRLLKQPVLHVYWTQCSDLETYKTVLYDEIKKWFHTLNKHGISDWLIVLVESYDFRKHTKLLPRATVLDKIKNDFCAKHVDRCLSVTNPLKSEYRTGSSWRALIVNMRLLMLSSYDVALSNLEEFIRVQRECRNNRDWNFCGYFLLQEELAFILEMLGMYEDALVQYDELDALFTQFVKNSSLTDAPLWLSSFQCSVTSWSSILLTCKVNQTQREAIQARNISLLDFRCYLFSRQAAMLLLTCKPWEVAKRTLPFIHNCLNEIKILEVEYPEGAISCWTYLCCMEVLLMCQRFNEPSHVDACSYYTAQLMEMAVAKLHVLGDLCGLMPDSQQSSEQLHTVVSLSSGIGDYVKFTNNSHPSPVDKLKEALSSKDAFRKHYLELCEQANIAYKYKGRMRCARFISKRIADFYMRSDDPAKACGFLSHALASYEEDDWPRLANEVRISLCQCYRQLGDAEKLLRTSISISCSSETELPIKQSYFEEITKILEVKNDFECIVPLEEAFTTNELHLTVEQTRVKVVLEILNKFPSDIDCSEMEVSIISQTNNVKLHDSLDSDDMYYYKNLRKTSNYERPIRLPLKCVVSRLENNSLAGASVVCENLECFKRHYLKQNLDNAEKADTPTEISKLLSTNTTLKPGKNIVTFHSKNEEASGKYRLGQLSITVSSPTVLRFTSEKNHFCQHKFSIRHVKPSVAVEALDDRIFIAGIPTNVQLKINMGTHTLEQDVQVKLLTIGNLKIGAKGSNELKEEMDFFVSKNSDDFRDNCFTFLMIASCIFPALTEGTIIDHKIRLRCPWWEKELCLLAQFYVPFVVVSRIHTARTRKFVLVTVSGLVDEPVRLLQSRLRVTDQPYRLQSLMSNGSPPFTVRTGRKIRFMWELLSANGIFSDCALSLEIKYSARGQIGNYSCDFRISNYATTYTIECKIEPSRGCEFCRVNTMCNLSVMVKRNDAVSDCSLMYEVVTDHTIWAICNTSTGVITLNETDASSITIDIMPLISGYLPMPLVKLSKYFLGDSNGNKGTSPRLESFNQGQIYNASKSSQVRVLPSANSEY